MNLRPHYVARCAIKSIWKTKSRLRISPKTAFGLFFFVGVVGSYSNLRYPCKTSAELQALREKAIRGSREKAVTSEASIRNVTRRLGKGMVDQLVQDYTSGTPTTELMTRFGLSKSSVLRLLKNNGVSMRLQPLDPSDIAKARILYEEQRCSLAAIALDMGLPRETIRVGLIAAGVPMRSRGRQAAS